MADYTRTCETCSGQGVLRYEDRPAETCRACEGRGYIPGRADDPVDHPKHYTQHPSGVECIEIVEHMNFNRGNAIKYVWRAGDKGDEIEDLKKARWYIEREIARLSRG